MSSYICENLECTRVKLNVNYALLMRMMCQWVHQPWQIHHKIADSRGHCVSWGLGISFSILAALLCCKCNLVSENNTYLRDERKQDKKQIKQQQNEMK